MILFVKIFASLPLLFSIAFNNNNYFSPLAKYSDQWNNEYFAPSNTAANSSYLNNEERLAIHVLNLARLSPRLFAATVLEPLTKNGYSPELSSLINTMNGISTLKLLYPSEEFYQLAKNQAALDAAASKADIERNIFQPSNTPDTTNGCRMYGNNNDPVQLIINLLLDKNDQTKTGRNRCLGDFKYMGISMQQVKKESYYSVIRFGEWVPEKKEPEEDGNKKYTTYWGGEITLWGNTTSNGYTTRGLGQEIYQDNETKTIEKLVIPWLLIYTNQYRKENGLDTLKYDRCLQIAAGYQTGYLFNESKEDHHFKLGHNQDSASRWFTGTTPSERALAAGCKKYCGENALYTFLLPVPEGNFSNRQKLNLAAKKIARDMVYDQWHNSKGHRDNMLFTGYTCLGVSVAIGKHYSNDSYINEKGETKILKDNSKAGWVAFGIQVMAY